MFSLRSMSEILQPFTFFTRSKGTFLCTGDTLSKRETLQMWSFLVFSIEEIQWNPNRHPRESSYWRLYCVVSFLLEWIEESDLLNLISASWKISSIVYRMRILLHRWKIKCFKLQLIMTKAHTCFLRKNFCTGFVFVCVSLPQFQLPVVVKVLAVSLAITVIHENAERTKKWSKMATAWQRIGTSVDFSALRKSAG